MIKPPTQFLIQLLSEAFHRGLRLGQKLVGKPRPVLIFKVGPVTLKGKSKMLEIAITTEEKVHVSITPKTEHGKPAKLDPNNPPKWSVLSGNCTLSPDEGGMGCWIVSPDVADISTVLVDADADLGEGVVDISDTIGVTVNGAMARSLGLVADPPVAKE